MQKDNSINIVLWQPQIPNNTGNIGRTCVATNAKLHLIKPLGFEISDSRVKRAGLDYWPDLDLQVHENFEQWLETVEDLSRVHFLSARAEKSIYDVEFKKGDYLVFGREADGLSEEIKHEYQKQLYKIPFPGKVRSFNLSNSVAMLLGECLRIGL